MKIAQRFNAGKLAKRYRVPEGRLRRPPQPSLRDLSSCPYAPRVETLGYCHLSLRDKQIALSLQWLNKRR
jgi:hypothetical protein